MSYLVTKETQSLCKNNIKNIDIQHKFNHAELETNTCICTENKATAVSFNVKLMIALKDFQLGLYEDYKLEVWK